jgi:hypothetical protein
MNMASVQPNACTLVRESQEHRLNARWRREPNMVDFPWVDTRERSLSYALNSTIVYIIVYIWSYLHMESFVY